MADMEKVIKRLEEAETMLAQAVDRGGEMAVMGAFKCLNHVSDAIALLKEQDTQNVVDMRLSKDWDRAASCPKCNESLKWVYHRNYCGYCGQAVK